jgi:hypothetical protein
MEGAPEPRNSPFIQETWRDVLRFFVDNPLGAQFSPMYTDACFLFYFSLRNPRTGKDAWFGVEVSADGDVVNPMQAIHVAAPEIARVINAYSVGGWFKCHGPPRQTMQRGASFPR